MNTKKIEPVARLTRIVEEGKGRAMFDEQPDGDPHEECAAEIHRLEQIIRRAANIMAGGEGVCDQGEAWDKTQRLLNDAVSAMTPADELTGGE